MGRLQAGRLYAQAFGGEPVDKRGAEEDVVVRLEEISADGRLRAARARRMRCEQTRCIVRDEAAACMNGRALAILNFSGVAEPGAEFEEERARVAAGRG